MHSILHHDFKTFVEAAHSPAAYQEILAEAGLDPADFEQENYRNDVELDQAITAAGKVLSQTRTEFLTDMGIAGSPGLMEQFAGFIEEGWNVLDMVEAIEPRMHTYVRAELGAMPPGLKTERVADNKLRVDILSHRNMAGLANGFIHGFAAEFGDTVDVEIDESPTGYTFHITKTN